MKKIYCVFCGEENNINDKKCVKCKKELNPKDHPWRDYLYNHIKSDLKGKTTDKLTSLIKNYVLSHMYGTVFAATLIVSASSLVVGAVNNNTNYITETNQKPVATNSITELSIDDELVKKLYKINSYNSERYFDMSQYENKFTTYDSFDDNIKLNMAYNYDTTIAKKIKFNSCEEFLPYKDDSLYKRCTEVPNYMDENYFVMDYKDFSKNYKSVFGTNKEAPKTLFYANFMNKCDYKKDMNLYFCYNLPVGWGYAPYEYTKLVKAYNINGLIVLYDYFIIFSPDGTFKDVEFNEKISDETTEDLVNQGQIYKHVYRKDVNGNYYWFSSEPVDMLP